MTAIVFDTETTGLLKPKAAPLQEQPEIIEIAAIKLDNDLNEIDRFESFIKPKGVISDEITRITGINEDMVANAPTFAELYPRLSMFFSGATMMVAHNCPFDREMVANDLRRIDKLLNFPWPMRHICTVECSMAIEQRRINLQTLHKYATGQEFQGAHRAMVDVEALVRCFIWLIKEGYVK